MMVACCVVIALSCGTLLTGCANQATSLASQACAHVERGLTAERKAASASHLQAVRLRAEALDQIRTALPLAAVAAGENTAWQALEATLSESSRVPLKDLVNALTAQCASPA